MSSRKSQNSLLVLTTLGVYLGLVLVGATPVLGHAATTRNFEISEEIEIKDDLDRKPDDKKRSPLETSIGNYYADIEFLLYSLERLRRAGKFDLAADTFELEQAAELPCVAGIQVGSYRAESLYTSNENLRQMLKQAAELMTDGYGFADCTWSQHFSGEKATHSHFALKLSRSELSLEVSGFKKSQADVAIYLRDLKTASGQFKVDATDPLKKQISESTKLSSVGNNILVVTRLPRAALDPLLAINAK